MNTITSRLKLVPGTAWVVGVLLAVSATLAIVLGPMTFDPSFQEFPSAARWSLLVMPPLLILAYALLVGFIYADAKRRKMRHVLWAWLALIPYFVGVILYFILRDPLPTPCPECGTEVQRAHAYCPSCGAAVHPTCSSCGKSLEAGWANCPFCGARVGSSVEATP